MEKLAAEMIGTAILILLGDGVVANVLLPKTNGSQSGWIVITFGWAMGVFVAVLCVADISGAHINPAVTVGLAAAGKFSWALVPSYIVAQLVGAMIGAGLVYAFYRDHYHASEDPDAMLATFCTGPKIRNFGRNFLSEVIGTFVLVFAVLMAVDPSIEWIGALEGNSPPDVEVGLGALGALPVALVVFAIGLSLGGTTGYAINPARDLGPRLIHWLVPIPGKRDSDWGYAWVPIAGPLAGAYLAVLCQEWLIRLTAAS